jgi:superfamily II DNA or RNA helicase
MLKRYITIPFGYVHSGSKKEANELGLDAVKSKEEIINFNNGNIQVLAGTRTLVTGVNMFPTHHVHNWTGGSSEIVTLQLVGRATRLLENSKFKHLHKPKPVSIIYDYNVTNKDLLKKHLEKRIEFYESTGGIVTFL